MTLPESDTPDEIPGQMGVEECIDVAASGADGKPPADSGRPDNGDHSDEKPRPLTAAEVVRRRLNGALPE